MIRKPKPANSSSNQRVTKSLIPKKSVIPKKSGRALSRRIDSRLAVNSPDYDPEYEEEDDFEKSSAPEPTKRPSRSIGSKKSTEESSEPTGLKKGWNVFQKKAAEAKARKEANELSIPDFRLNDGETAIIEFLDHDPILVEVHSVKNGRGRYMKAVCQKTTQRHCLMCSAGIRSTTMGAFKILDHRGNWDKESKDFKWDEPVERKILTGSKMLSQLQNFSDKKSMRLDEMVIEITRSGSQTDTSYNLELAFDPETRKPYELTENFEEKKLLLEEDILPMSDDQLEAIGFESYD